MKRMILTIVTAMNFVKQAISRDIIVDSIKLVDNFLHLLILSVLPKTLVIYAISISIFCLLVIIVLTITKRKNTQN